MRCGTLGHRPRRPTGAFMFLGPTGVGKTELAKALAGSCSTMRAGDGRIDARRVRRSTPWLS